MRLNLREHFMVGTRKYKYDASNEKKGGRTTGHDDIVTEIWKVYEIWA